MEVKIKRVYEEKEKSDGFRVFIDRLWPRGIKKEDLPFDLWLKDIAPTPEIRKEFNHERKNFKTFGTKYRRELKEKEDLLNLLRDKNKKQNLTLLYAAKDEKCNHALILKDVIEND